MFGQLFESVYGQYEVAVSPKWFLLSLVISLLLGSAIAQIYKRKNLYTQEFVLLITILPSLISILVFLVNGNLGTSVAVAGTFSLIRFRSAAGGAKELLSLFMAMAVGLAVGTGFLVFAVISTFFLLGATLLLEKSGFAKTNSHRRQLSLTMPIEANYEVLLEAILERHCSFVELTGIQTQPSKQLLTLDYVVDLRPQMTDQSLIKELLSYKEDIKIEIGKVANKKKSL